jgi:hypothetical protein
VQLQKFLGHHSPVFTLAVYVHLVPDDLPEPAFLDEIAGSVAEAAALEQAEISPSRGRRFGSNL